jgi:hypothetical protein
MFCTQCGTQLDEGKKFCKKCGASLDKTAEAAASAQTQVLPSFSDEAAAAARSGQTSIDRTQALPISPSREGRGVNKAVLAAAGLVMLIAAGVGVYFGTDVFRSPGSKGATELQKTAAKVAEPARTPPVDVPKEMAGIADAPTDSDFNSPLWTTPAESSPPVAREFAKSPTESRPTPITDPPTVARKGPSQPPRQESRARERAPAPPAPASVARPPASPGTYQTVRPTRVFESPSAAGRVVARIDDGIRVNVVGSTGDWLEVRSRSGNPPGFIRRDDAVPIE